MIDRIEQTVTSEELTTEEKERSLHNFIFLMKSKSLLTTLRGDHPNLSTRLREVATRLDKYTAGGSLHSLTGKLVMEVKTMLGFITKNQS